jgi:hypothetical protein
MENGYRISVSSKSAADPQVQPGMAGGGGGRVSEYSIDGPAEGCYIRTCSQSL